VYEDVLTYSCICIALTFHKTYHQLELFERASALSLNSLDLRISSIMNINHYTDIRPRQDKIIRFYITCKIQFLTHREQIAPVKDKPVYTV
jgi:hypothetical protein